MKIQERSFAGKIFQPKPQCYLSSNKNLLVVITPWGQESVNTESLFEKLETQYNFFSKDKESTHPFPKMLSLTPLENNIRTTVIQINQDVFHNVNETEYSVGFELFLVAKEGDTIAFVQIGRPVVLLDRSDQPLQSIGQAVQPKSTTKKEHQPPLADQYLQNMAWKVSSSQKGDHQENLPLLPYHLVGVYEDISFHPVRFRRQKGDRLILLSQNDIPVSWFQTKREERTIDNFSRLAVEENPHAPFWFALLDLMED